MKINRAWAMSNSRTFSIPPIRELIEHYVGWGDVIVDPFANDSKIGTITKRSPTISIQNSIPITTWTLWTSLNLSRTLMRMWFCMIRRTLHARSRSATIASGFR